MVKNKIEIENVDTLNIDYEKFKATYSQSKQNGLIYFEVTTPAATIKELETVGRQAIKICLGLCNEFNGKNLVKADDKKIVMKKGKKDKKKNETKKKLKN